MRRLDKYIRYIRRGLQREWLGAEAISISGLHLGSVLPYIGYAHYGNLGDEALYEAISMCLKQALDPVQYDSDAYTWDVFFLLNKPKYFCLGGGSLLFHEKMLSQIKILSDHKLVGFSFGTGGLSTAPPPGSSTYIKKWKDELLKFKKISVRGNITANYLQSLGISSVQIVGDPVLTLAPDYSDVGKTSHGLNGIVGINIRGRSRLSESEINISHSIEEAGRSLLKQGYKLVVVSMSKADDPFTKGLFNRLVLEGPVDFVPYNPSWNHHMNKIAGCDVLIGLRLHFAVLGCCLGIPVVAFDGPSQKYLDFMDSMGLRQYLLPWNGITQEAILNAVRSASDNKENISKQILSRVAEFKNRIHNFALEIIEEL